MSLIRPFRGLRPAAGRADAVVAPPYDVLNTEEARERARAGPVDLVGEHHVREYRALDELEAPGVGRRILLDDVRAGDVTGHQVRRELDALKFQTQSVGEAVSDQGFGQSRIIFEQDMSFCEDGGHDLIE